MTAAGADGGPARLFVALPVPVAVRRALEEVQARIREQASDLRFTRPAGWHVTLAFLGDVAGERVGEVTEVVAEVVAGSLSGSVEGAAPVQLALGGPGRFGQRVLWVGVDDDPPGTIAALGERIQAAIADAGLPVQRQAVRPHLTLARGGRNRPVRDRHLDDLQEALAAAGADGAAWTAGEVQVWRSELGRGPARYHVLSSTPLR